jgi:hypothetical protein
LAQIFLFSLTAALNPTLLTAVTVMLVLPSPTRLLLGYLLGALMMSVTLGLVIVFSLDGSSSAISTAKHTVNPALDIALGLLILVVAFVVGSGRDQRRRARRERKRAAKGDQPPPRWKQALSGGSPRTTFVVGALLTLPGASYLAGLHLISKQNASTSATVLVVLGFNVVMLMLLELPLLGYAIRPDGTAVAIERFSGWLSRNGGRVALGGSGVVGVALIARGTVGLLS